MMPEKDIAEYMQDLELAHARFIHAVKLVKDADAEYLAKNPDERRRVVSELHDSEQDLRKVELECLCKLIRVEASKQTGIYIGGRWVDSASDEWQRIKHTMESQP